MERSSRECTKSTRKCRMTNRHSDLAGHFKFQDEHHQTEAVLAVRSGAIACAADMGTASTRLRKHHRPSSRKKNVSHITPRSQPRANKNQGPNEPSCSAP